jgi:WD40 repeat protein
MHISQRSFMPIAAMSATMAVVGIAQIRSDITPGEVVIATTPHADIFLDEARLGAASSIGSFVIHNAKPGPHTLRVTMDGKQPFSKRIVVAAGKTNQLTAELGDLTGDLEVLTTAGAEILLNGKSVGLADGTGTLLIRGLNEPHYKIRATKAGRTSEELQISLATSMVSSINLELKLADEVNQSTAAPPPDYVLQRRLVFSEGSSVDEVFFQAESGRLVSASAKDGVGNIMQWDPSTGRLLQTIEVKAKYGILAVSPDLRWVALPFATLNSKTLDSIQLVEAANGRIVCALRGFKGRFTPDSKRLAIEMWPDPKVVFWDIESGRQLETWPEADWIRYSPDGHRVATTGSGEGLTIREAETGKTIQQLPTPNSFHRAAFSPDGRWLAVITREYKIELWEIATGRQRRTFVSPPLPSKFLDFRDLVFTPDSAHIVSITSASNSQANKQTGIRLLDTFTGREIRTWPAENPNAIAVSPDGRWLALHAGPSIVTVWKKTE